MQTHAKPDDAPGASAASPAVPKFEATCVFADEIVHWQKSHGRNNLPWQNTQDPYRVWLSEIMLQQTQVAAVLAYYARFVQRFVERAQALTRPPQSRPFRPVRAALPSSSPTCEIARTGARRSRC